MSYRFIAGVGMKIAIVVVVMAVRSWPPPQYQYGPTSWRDPTLVAVIPIVVVVAVRDIPERIARDHVE